MPNPYLFTNTGPAVQFGGRVGAEERSAGCRRGRHFDGLPPWTSFSGSLNDGYASFIDEYLLILLNTVITFDSEFLTDSFQFRIDLT